jgi:hypothetical protein
LSGQLKISTDPALDALAVELLHHCVKIFAAVACVVEGSAPPPQSSSSTKPTAAALQAITSTREANLFITVFLTLLGDKFYLHIITLEKFFLAIHWSAWLQTLC